MAAPGFRYLGENWGTFPPGMWIAAGEGGVPVIYGESLEHLADQLEDPEKVTIVFKPDGAIG